jgi:hypothetical protein
VTKKAGFSVDFHSIDVDSHLIMVFWGFCAAGFFGDAWSDIDDVASALAASLCGCPGASGPLFILCESSHICIEYIYIIIEYKIDIDTYATALWIIHVSFRVDLAASHVCSPFESYGQLKICEARNLTS